MYELYKANETLLVNEIEVDFTSFFVEIIRMFELII